mmetsp:Transcript_14253/g.27781  ORF Transcript_14253/g.27781 Transcript_14253/m.27781 type:complete len:242 (+) Transcript_14253:3620-4345(+)
MSLTHFSIPTSHTCTISNALPVVSSMPVVCTHSITRGGFFLLLLESVVLWYTPPTGAGQTSHLDRCCCMACAGDGGTLGMSPSPSADDPRLPTDEAGPDSSTGLTPLRRCCLGKEEGEELDEAKERGVEDEADVVGRLEAAEAAEAAEEDAEEDDDAAVGYWRRVDTRKPPSLWWTLKAEISCCSPSRCASFHSLTTPSSQELNRSDTCRSLTTHREEMLLPAGLPLRNMLRRSLPLTSPL